MTVRAQVRPSTFPGANEDVKMAEAALTERTNVNVHLVTEEDSAKNVIVNLLALSFFLSPCHLFTSWCV